MRSAGGSICKASAGMAMSQVVGILRPAISVNAFGVMVISAEAICRVLPSGKIQLPESVIVAVGLAQPNSISFSPEFKCSENQSHPV